MNPILPLSYYMPDVEARVWNDENIYLYGSWDLQGNTEYCSREYYVMHSHDFKQWVRSERAFSNRNNEVPWGDGLLFAPDCICKNGKYYLYFCLSDGSEGMAESSDPCGPFQNPVPVQGADGLGIDPAVFMDDDGKIYYYWGQFQLYGAQMSGNMREVIPKTIKKGILTEDQHGFHEGASMRKRGKYYYLVYTDISRGKATCLSYAIAESPLGPFRKGGVIIDNIGCDPMSWNNHGSIQEINGQWYVFYHRSTHGSKYSRRVCVEPIYFDVDGIISEVEMTTSGIERSIAANIPLQASRSSRLKGTVYIDSNIETGEEYLNHIEDGDWAEYKYLSFSGENIVQLDVLCKEYGGKIEIRLDAPQGSVVGTVAVKNRKGWQRIEEKIEPVRGIHAVYFVFHGKEGTLFRIKKFVFKKV